MGEAAFDGGRKWESGISHTDSIGTGRNDDR